MPKISTGEKDPDKAFYKRRPCPIRVLRLTYRILDVDLPELSGKPTLDLPWLANLSTATGLMVSESGSSRFDRRRTCGVR